MKTKYSFICLLAAIASLVSCNDKFKDTFFEGEGGEISFTPTEGFYNLALQWDQYNASAYGETPTNIVYAAGSPWKITTASDWVTVTPTTGEPLASASDVGSGTPVSVTVAPNPYADGEPRVSISTVELTDPKAPKLTRDFAVNQAQGSGSKIVMQTQGPINIPGGTSTFQFTFTADGSWSIYSYNSNWKSKGGFLSVDPGNGNHGTYTVTATVDPNLGSQPREFYVYVHSTTNTSYDSDYLYITQDIASMDVVGQPRRATVNIGNSATELEFEVESQGPWSCESSNASWLSITPTTGTEGTTKVKVTATSNAGTAARQATLSFSLGDLSSGNGVWIGYVQITIIQAGLYLNVTPADQTIGSAAGSKGRITVSANTAWTATTPTPWLTLDKTSGDGDATVTVSADENANTYTRTGVVYITSAATGQKHEVLVRQLGKNIYVKGDVLNFSDEASSMKVYLSADAEWTSTTKADWITVSPTTGDTGSEITVSVTENKTEDERTDSVLFTMLDKQAKLYVHQQGKYVNFYNSSLSFTSKGGKGVVSFGTNDSWTASLSDQTGWVKASPTSGTKTDTQITVNVEPNNKLVDRTADLTITMGSTGRKKTIPVLQGMRYLTTNMEQVTFMSSGGKYEQPLAIDCDGAYSVSHNSSWLTVTAEKEGSPYYYIEATANNSGASRTDTIVVKCTDLEEGVLERRVVVRQVSNASELLIEDYKDTDMNWNVVKSDDFTITLTSYGTDKKWQGNSSDNPSAITVTPYEEDKNWNKE